MFSNTEVGLKGVLLFISQFMESTKGFKLVKLWYDAYPGEHPREKNNPKEAVVVSTMRSKKRRGKLSEERIRACESLPGWGTPVKDRRLAESFENVKRWYQEHPGKHPDAKTTLSNYVSHKRSQYSKGKLPDDEIMALGALPGWSWSDPRMHDAIKRVAKWYADNPGQHPSARTKTAEAHFVGNRRADKIKGILPKDVVQSLESIPGWEWEPVRKASGRIATLRALVDNFNPRCVTTRQQLEWMAGFLAGDGCIYIGSDNVGVTYGQAEKGIDNLLYIQRLEGGTILDTGEPAKDTHQRKFELYMNYDTSTRHLTNLRDVMIHKKRQLEIGLEFPRNMTGLPATKRLEIWSTRKALVEESGRLKKDYAEDIDDSKMTLSFIGGFFAAEGSVCLSRRGGPQINITQKSPKMLESIKRFWGFGGVSGGKWYIGSDFAEIFARTMFGRCGCKDTVLKVIIDYMDEFNAESRKRSMSIMSEDRIRFYRELLRSLNGITVAPLKPVIPSTQRKRKAETGLPVGLNARNGGSTYYYRVEGKTKNLGPRSGVHSCKDAIRVYEKHLNALADARALRIRDAVNAITSEDV